MFYYLGVILVYFFKLICLFVFTWQVHLALYCHNAGLASVALKLMYRARHLAVLVYGEGHPDMATFDVNIYPTSKVE